MKLHPGAMTGMSLNPPVKNTEIEEAQMLKDEEQPITTSKESRKRVTPKQWALYLLMVVVFIGFFVMGWHYGKTVGRESVLGQIKTIDTSAKEPTLVEEKIFSMVNMSWTYTQSTAFVPNTSFGYKFLGAQLYNAEDYIVYIRDAEGNEYHTSLAQCKLALTFDTPSSDPTQITLRKFKEADHPFVIFNMNYEEFSKYVSPQYMPDFSDGMITFVYQYLAETVPIPVPSIEEPNISEDTHIENSPLN